MSSSKRTSLTEHHQKGLTLAEHALAHLLGAKKDRLGFEDLRAEIEKLPDTTQLQVTIADCWLNLSKKQSQERRKNQPPRNPFQKVGKDLLAQKGDIRDWDQQWLQFEWLRVGKRMHAQSGSLAARRMAGVINQQIAALLSSDKMVGFVDATSPAALQQAIQHPEQLRVKLVSLDEAISRRWLITSDQLDLIDVTAVALRAHRDEVAALPSDG